jgi:hypothetical protein
MIGIFFKFNGVTIENGDLSLKVQFPEDGNYQIISQVCSKDNVAIALTSFNIFVPLQPFGKFVAFLDFFSDSCRISSNQFVRTGGCNHVGIEEKE